MAASAAAGGAGGPRGPAEQAAAPGSPGQVPDRLLAAGDIQLLTSGGGLFSSPWKNKYVTVGWVRDDLLFTLLDREGGATELTLNLRDYNARIATADAPSGFRAPSKAVAKHIQKLPNQCIQLCQAVDGKESDDIFFKAGAGSTDIGQWRRMPEFCTAARGKSPRQLEVERIAEQRRLDAIRAQEEAERQRQEEARAAALAVQRAAEDARRRAEEQKTAELRRIDEEHRHRLDDACGTLRQAAALGRQLPAIFTTSLRGAVDGLAAAASDNSSRALAAGASGHARGTLLMSTEEYLAKVGFLYSAKLDTCDVSSTSSADAQQILRSLPGLCFLAGPGNPWQKRLEDAIVFYRHRLLGLPMELIDAVLVSNAELVSRLCGENQLEVGSVPNAAVAVRDRYVDVLLPSLRHPSWLIGRSVPSLVSAEWCGPGGCGHLAGPQPAGASQIHDDPSNPVPLGTEHLLNHYAKLLLGVDTEDHIYSADKWPAIYAVFKGRGVDQWVTETYNEPAARYVTSILKQFATANQLSFVCRRAFKVISLSRRLSTIGIQDAMYDDGHGPRLADELADIVSAASNAQLQTWHTSILQQLQAQSQPTAPAVLQELAAALKVANWNIERPAGEAGKPAMWTPELRRRHVTFVMEWLRKRDRIVNSVIPATSFLAGLAAGAGVAAEYVCTLPPFAGGWAADGPVPTSAEVDMNIVAHVVPVYSSSQGRAHVVEIGFSDDARFELDPSCTPMRLVPSVFGVPFSVLCKAGAAGVPPVAELHLRFNLASAQAPAGAINVAELCIAVGHMVVNLRSGAVSCSKLALPCTSSKGAVGLWCQPQPGWSYLEKMRLSFHRVALLVWGDHNLDTVQQQFLSSLSETSGPSSPSSEPSDSTAAARSTLMQPVQEAGAVLADLLSHLSITATSSSSEEAQAFVSQVLLPESRCRLLFSVGTRLRTAELQRSYVAFWSHALQHRPNDHNEAKELLLQLLCDPLASTAVVPVDLATDMLRLLTCTTHHSVSVLSVAPSNLESVIRQIETESLTAPISFIFLQVTGNVSPTDMARLVSVADGHGCKVVLLAQSHVLYCLSVTGKLSGLLLSSATQAISVSVTWRCRAYAAGDAALPLDSCIERTSAINVTELSVDNPVFHVFNPPAQALEQLGASRQSLAIWVKRELEFRQAWAERGRAPGGTSALPDFAIIVAEDMDAVEAYYRRADPGSNLATRVVSAVAMTAVHDAIAAAAEPLSPTPGRLIRAALILIGANLMSARDKAATLRRAIAVGVCVVMVCPNLDPQDLEVHIHGDASGTGADDAHQSSVLRPMVLEAGPTKLLYALALSERCRVPPPDAFLLFFRAARLVLGSAVTLSLFDPSTLDKSWLVAPAAVMQAIHRGTGGLVDLSIVQVFVNQLVQLAYGLVPPDVAPLDLHAGGIDYVRWLAGVCFDQVKRTPAERDQPFAWFLHHWRPSQLMSQRHSIAAWLVWYFHPYMEEHALGVASVLPPLGFNVHSHQLLTYFSPGVAALHGLPTGSNGYLAPAFTQVVPWEEFLVGQAALAQELPWHTLYHDAAFPSSVHVLLQLLRVHPHPWKVLLSIRAPRLFELLGAVDSSMSAGLTATVMQRMGDLLSDFATLALVGHPLDSSGATDAPLSPVHYHLAVMKWHLLQSDWAARVTSFTAADLQALIQLRVPLGVSVSQVGRVVPLLRSVADVNGANVLYQHVGIRNTILELDYEHIRSLFVVDDAAALPTGTTMPEPAPPGAVDVLGAALVEFLLTPDVMIASRRAAMSGQLLAIRHPFSRHLQAWLSSNDPGHLFRRPDASRDDFGLETLPTIYVPNMGYPMLESKLSFWQAFPAAVTARAAKDIWVNYRALQPQAVALLVCKATSAPQAQWLHHVVCAIIASLPSDAAQASYMQRLLAALQGQRNWQRGYEFVQGLYLSDDVRPVLLGAWNPNGQSYWGAVIACLQRLHHHAPAVDGTQDSVLTPLLEWYAAARTRGSRDGALAQALPPFPMHDRGMAERFEMHFSDDRVGHLLGGGGVEADADETVDLVIAMLGRRNLAALCQDLSRRPQLGRMRFLLVVSWAFYPFPALSATQGEFNLLTRVVRHPEVDFARTIRQHTAAVSQLALYLGTVLGLNVPSCVPVSVYNHFSQRYGMPLLAQHAFVAAGRRDPSAAPTSPFDILMRMPPVTVQVVCRPHPREVLEQLNAAFLKAEASSDREQFDVHNVVPGPQLVVDVRTGISVGVLQGNLRVLLTCLYKLQLKELFVVFTQAKPDWANPTNGYGEWESFMNHILTGLFQYQSSISEANVMYMLPQYATAYNTVWAWLHSMGATPYVIKWLSTLAQRVMPVTAAIPGGASRQAVKLAARCSTIALADLVVKLGIAGLEELSNACALPLKHWRAVPERQTMEGPAFFVSLVDAPLPHGTPTLVDAYWSEAGSSRLLRPTPEDAEYSVQCFNAILPHPLVGSFTEAQPSALVTQDPRTGSWCATDAYRALPAQYCTYLGSRVGFSLKAVRTRVQRASFLLHGTLVLVTDGLVGPNSIQSMIAGYTDLLTRLHGIAVGSTPSTPTSPSNRADHARQGVQAMIDAFLEGVRTAIADLDAFAQSECTAMLHRALFESLGVAATKHAAAVHSMILPFGYQAHGMVGCRITMEQLRRYGQVDYPPVMSEVDTERQVWSRQPLWGNVCVETHAHTQVPLTAANVMSALASEASHAHRLQEAASRVEEVHTDAAECVFHTASESGASQWLGIVGRVDATDVPIMAQLADTLRPNFRSSTAIGNHGDTFSASEASGNGNDSGGGRVVVLCDELIDVQVWQGVAEVVLKQCRDITVLRIDDGVLEFRSQHRPRDQAQAGQLPAATGDIVATFDSEVQAWAFVCKLAGNTSLVLRDIILVKHGALWVPLVSVGGIRGPQGCGAPVWDVLAAAAAVGLVLPGEVSDLLFLVCEAVQTYHSYIDRGTPLVAAASAPSRAQLLEWFRDFSKPAYSAQCGKLRGYSDAVTEFLSVLAGKLSDAPRRFDLVLLQVLQEASGVTAALGARILGPFLLAAKGTRPSVQSLIGALVTPSSRRLVFGLLQHDGHELHAVWQRVLDRSFHARSRRLLGRVACYGGPLSTLPPPGDMALRLAGTARRSELRHRPRVAATLGTNTTRRTGSSRNLRTSSRATMLRTNVGADERSSDSSDEDSDDGSSRGASHRRRPGRRNVLPPNVLADADSSSPPSSGSSTPTTASATTPAVVQPLNLFDVCNGERWYTAGLSAMDAMAAFDRMELSFMELLCDDGAPNEAGVTSLVGAFCQRMLWLPGEQGQSGSQAASGPSLVLGYLVHDSALSGQLDTVTSGQGAVSQQVLALRRAWLQSVLESPLTWAVKEEVLCICTTGAVRVRGNPPVGDINDLIILWGLMLRCPTQLVQVKLRELHTSMYGLIQAERDAAGGGRQSSLRQVPLFWSPDSGAEDFWCRRAGGPRDDQYGMRVVPSGAGMLDSLLAQRVRVCVLDFGQWFQGSAPPDVSLYNSIQSSFWVQSVCFVYVRGLRRVSDALWKWCAEFTQRHCWAYIVFEGTSTAWLLPENQDRCVRSIGLDDRESSEASSLAFRVVHYPGQGEPAVGASVGMLASALERNWQQRFVTAFESSRWVLLVGSPGIGKTFYLRNDFLAHLAQRPERFTPPVFIDGSNDIFTRQALVDVVARLVDLNPARPGVVVIDEFHLMSTELKKQLLQWFRGAMSSIRMVLISNRFDQEDVALLQQISDGSSMKRSRLARRMDSTAPIIVAGGSVAAVMEKMVLPQLQLSQVTESGVDHHSWLMQRIGPDMPPAYCRALLFVHVWTMAAYRLFGASCLSLRHIYSGCPVLWTLAATKSDALPSDAGMAGLVKHLRTQVPHANGPLALQFVRFVISVYQELLGTAQDIHQATVQAFCRTSVAVARSASLAPSDLEDICARFDDERFPMEERTKAVTLRLTERAAVGTLHFFQVMLARLGAAVASHCRSLLNTHMRSTDHTAHPLVLVFMAALCDTAEDTMSYPEFVATSTALYLYHPVRRLAAWIAYLVQRSESVGRGGVGEDDGIPDSGLTTAQDQLVVAPEAMLMFDGASIASVQSGGGTLARMVGSPTAAGGSGAGSSVQVTYHQALGKLRSMQLRDVPLSFPQIFTAAGPADADLGSCRAVCAPVALWDLHDVISALKHGFSIDWDQAKLYWSQHPLTDSDAISKLFSVWPAALQELVTPLSASSDAAAVCDPGIVRGKLLQNIRQLISVGGVAFSWRCVRLSSDGRSIRQLSRDPTWPPMLAAWRLYRHLPLDQLQRLDLPEQHADRLAYLLLWASRFGVHSMDVADASQERHQLLKVHLLVASCRLRDAAVSSGADGAGESSEAWADAVALWTHQFAGLMPDPGVPHAIIDSAPAAMGSTMVQSCRVTFDLVWRVAQFQYPPNPSWPHAVKVLCELEHGQGDAAEVSALIEKYPQFWIELRNAPPDFIARVLSCPHLSRAVQQLTLQAPIEITASTREDARSIAVKLELGLASLPSFDEVQVRGQLVREELRQVFLRHQAMSASD